MVLLRWEEFNNAFSHAKLIALITLSAIPMKTSLTIHIYILWKKCVSERCTLLKHYRATQTTVRFEKGALPLQLLTVLVMSHRPVPRVSV